MEERSVDRFAWIPVVVRGRCCGGHGGAAPGALAAANPATLVVADAASNEVLRFDTGGAPLPAPGLMGPAFAAGRVRGTSGLAYNSLVGEVFVTGSFASVRAYDAADGTSRGLDVPNLEPVGTPRGGRSWEPLAGVQRERGAVPGGSALAAG